MKQVRTFPAQRFNTRTTLPGPTDDFWYDDIWPGVFSGSGVDVNPGTAERVAAVHACVNVISESVAMLPVMVFRHTGELSKEKATKNPLWKLLRVRPNRWMDSFRFFEMMQRHLLLRGNAFAQKLVNSLGSVVELVPLNPDRVRIVLDENMNLTYEYSDPKNQKEVRVFQQQEMFHVANHSDDGINGKSPIELVSDSIGFGLALQTHGNALFKNGAAPHGLLKLQGALKNEEQLQRLRKSWNDMYGGPSQSGKIGILEQGTEYEAITMNSRDAQFIEARKFSVSEIARIFRVPPHLIQDLDKATFSNIEEESINFVRYTLQPWLKRWEDAIEFSLLPEASQEKIIVRFQTNSLLRGDFKTRQEGYASAIQNGYMSRDEVRFLEDFNPIPEGKGEDFLVPLNLGVAGEDPEEEKEEEPKEESPKDEKSFKKLFQDLLIRCITKEINAVKRAFKKPNSLKTVSDFYEKHESYMAESLECAADAYIAGGSARVGGFVSEYIEIRANFVLELCATGENSAILTVTSFRRETNFWADTLMEFLGGSDETRKNDS